MKLRRQNIFMAQKNDKPNLIALFRHFEKLSKQMHARQTTDRKMPS